MPLHFVSFTYTGWECLGLRAGVLHPSARAFDSLAAMASTPGAGGPRLAAALATLHAELAGSAPL